ncbi:hypothetical protein [Streptomyces luteireticuli]|uniref:hypothetical protein n=1 Tax=Streptomyces luteireticuli TaxID=173858 RepID=UPI003557FA86
MSRESDSPSSGPQGRGGAAYPSGTPPYGPTGDGTPDAPKTETTLTTRIRINIPGSRPIPPVVMRTPVGDEASDADGAPRAERERPAAAAPAPAPEAERPAEKTSDWFAPRKSAGASATPPGGTPTGGGAPGGAMAGGAVPGGNPPGGNPSGGLPRRTPQQGPGAPGAGHGPRDLAGGGAAPHPPLPGDPMTAQGPNPAAGANPMAGANAPRPGGQGGAPFSGGPVAGGPGAPGVSGGPGSARARRAARRAEPWPGDAAAAPGQGPGGLSPSPSTTGTTPLPGGPIQGGPVQGGPMQGGPLQGGPMQGGAPYLPNDSSTTGAMPVPNDPFAGPQGPAAGAAAPWPGGPGATGQGPVPGGAMSTTGTTPLPGGSMSTTGSTPVPGDPSTTASMPLPGDPFAGPQGQGGGAGAPWTADALTGGAAPQAPGAAQWNGPGAPETTQQFPAPGADQGRQGPRLPFPVGGQAGGRTDTPHAGTPVVPPPGPGAPQGGAVQQGKTAQQGKKKKGGPKGGAQGGPKAPNAPKAQRPGDPAAETLVSGMPPVPGPGGPKKPVDAGAPRVAVPRPKSGGGSAVPKPPVAQGAPSGVPKPAAKPAPKAAAKAAPKKKGRSKVVLLAGGVIVLAGVAYGAGLVMNHSDVPQGTTVLGVDIGGSSKEQAVQKLDAKLGDRANAPLKVTIAGKQAELKPSVAGLSIDTQETVRSVSGRDYNPVTVVGSLVGSSRTAEPTVIVDEEKVAAALKALSGEAGGAKDGTILFKPGKAVAVYGKPYQGIDTGKAVKAVADAYRARAESGTAAPVALPSANQQPKVDNAEVDRMMEEFAKPAMSGRVTIQTDPFHSIPFGPDISLPKILSVKEVNGKLVESYNLDVLKSLYGSKFNGVLIERGNGTKTPVTPQDVAGALGKALRGKTPAERVGVIKTKG